MDSTERDDLLQRHGETLAKLLERSDNTYHIVEKIEQHLVIQNGRVGDNTKKIWYMLGAMAILGTVSGVALYHAAG